MRRWHHEVSAEWLVARQQVITATDVVNLLPEYKRYVKAGSPDDKIFPGFAALWCKKHSNVYLDTSSTDAAARGHIMEPYAIDSWNRQADPKFEHWDDCVIVNGIYGFSPDALTVRQRLCCRDTEKSVKHSMIPSHAEVMEVKCYMPEQHMKSFIEGHMDHKEIMQVAMAFKVLDKLEVARILWFCPGAPISMFEEHYTRQELNQEIGTIRKVVEAYEKQAELCEQKVPNIKAMYTEEEIYMDYIASMQGGEFMLK